MSNINKNPIVNALLALVYIVLVALVMRYAEKTNPDESFFAPIAFLSLFTLSAAVMGYLFLSRPLQLFLEGQKKEATQFFIKTLASFGILTAVVLLIEFL